MLSSRLLRGVVNPARRLYSTGVWSDFSKRPESLKLIDQQYQNDLLKGIDPEVGPASIEQEDRKLAYHSPVAIDETFAMAYELLQTESKAVYDQIAVEKDQAKIDQLSVKAEKYNPEVLFNIENFPEKIDREQPVYRKYLKELWESHDKMLTMQRLEQHHVIPDTLPTLVPVAEVKVKFPHNTASEFKSWVEPGTILPAFAVSKPPTIQIQEFERIAKDLLYSVILVNPDTPDLDTNTFKTTLQYGLCNVPLSNSDISIDTLKLLQHGDKYTFCDYEPLVPEKNAQTQRACLWVFRQEKELPVTNLNKERDSFDIRSFTEQHGLTAVGAHMWRQAFDRSVNAVREDYNLGKGRVFHRVKRNQPVIDYSGINVV